MIGSGTLRRRGTRMETPMKYAFFLLLAFALTLPLAAVSHARDEALQFSVEVALNSALAKQKVRGVPLYMAGQWHQAVVRDMGVFKSNKATRAVGRSDQEACNVAFLSAIISLQERAISEGGDAVVDIRSVTTPVNVTNAMEFGCRAGNAIAHVALEGRVVSFK